MCWKFGYRMHHKRNQRGSNMILIGVRNHVHGPMIKHTWCVYDERVHIDFKIARAGLVRCFRAQKLSVTRGAFGTCRCLALCTFLSQKSRPIKKFRIPYWLLCSVMYKIMPCIIGRISQYGGIVNIFLFFWEVYCAYLHVLRVIRYLGVNYSWLRILSLSGMWGCEICLLIRGFDAVVPRV
jgi:hypothetical protein